MLKRVFWKTCVKKVYKSIFTKTFFFVNLEPASRSCVRMCKESSSSLGATVAIITCKSKLTKITTFRTTEKLFEKIRKCWFVSFVRSLVRRCLTNSSHWRTDLVKKNSKIRATHTIVQPLWKFCWNVLERFARAWSWNVFFWLVDLLLQVGVHTGVSRNLWLCHGASKRLRGISWVLWRNLRLLECPNWYQPLAEILCGADLWKQHMIRSPTAWWSMDSPLYGCSS